MADTTLRPRTIVEILDGAFAIFRRDYLKFVSIMAVISLPYQVVMLFWNRSYLASVVNSSGGADDLNVAFGGILLPLLTTILWNPIVDATIVTAAAETYHGRELNIGATFRTLASRFLSLLSAIFLRAVPLMLGFVLLLIPGIYLYLRWFNVPAVIMLEKSTALGSLARSSILTKGSKGKIAVTMIIIYIILGCLQFLSLLASILTSNIMMLAVVQAVLNVLLYPLFPICMALLYYDMRIRKEGYDIELMSSELGDATAAEPA